MTHTWNASYRYEPLDSDKSSIRLIELLPGRWDEPIQCNLERSSLDVFPQYEALSYMWGDVLATTNIFLCGRTVRITKNLELALRYLRRVDSSRILWIDALCIDQTNITEKNQQVPEMWRIFSRAEKVIAWLGESDEHSDAAFDSVLALDVALNSNAASNTTRDHVSPSTNWCMGKAGSGKSTLVQMMKQTVIGIDFSTSFTGVTLPVLYRDSTVPEDIVIIKDWGPRMTNASKIPSEISYTPLHEQEKFGVPIEREIPQITWTKLQLDVGSRNEELDWTVSSLEASAKLEASDQSDDTSTLNQYNWFSILKLLNRPYFGRIWVVQELFYAGDIFNEHEDRCVFACGKRTLPRHLLLKAWQLLEGIEVSKASYEQHGYAWLFGQADELNEPLKTLVSHGTLHGQPDAPEIFNVLRDACMDSSDKLSRLITSTMSFRATDPRDKVYALLKMAGISDVAFHVDYSQSANHVLRAITIHAIIESQSLRILEGNRHNTNNVTPSWIPDSSVLPVRSIEWTPHNRFASRGASLSCEYIEAGGLLQLPGIAVGKIKTKIGPFRFGRGFTEEALLPLKDFYKALDISRHDAFWRTLVMDLDRTNALQRSRNHPAPAEFGSMCAHFLGTAEQGQESHDDNNNDMKRNSQSTSLYLTNFYDSAQRRCFIECDNGLMGLGPYDAMPGDAVVILFGADVCFTLRPKGDFYQLIGDCYIHGAMQGQMMIPDGTGSFAGKQAFLLC